MCVCVCVFWGSVVMLLLLGGGGGILPVICFELGRGKRWMCFRRGNRWMCQFIVFVTAFWSYESYV